MKNFSLIKNNNNPNFPKGYVMVFGYEKNAVAYTDYEGVADCSTPANVQGEWFPLSTDFDSVMAWHGERRKQGRHEFVRVKWQ